MLELLYSKNRESGDRELLRRIKNDVSEGKKVTLLVPEQQVYNAELMLSYNDILSPELEVVGFRRLCESIFRRFGGLAYNNISDGARIVLMWRTIAELSPMLKEYGNIMLDDIETIKSLVASVGELSLYSVSPKTLETAAGKLSESDEKLSRKLYDLSLIAAANSALLKTEYNDPAEDTKRAAEILEDHNYFADRSVYVAQFVSFTVYEKKIIENVIKDAQNTVFFVGKARDDKREIFEMLSESELFVKKCAASLGKKCIFTELCDDNAGQAPDICYLTENIWNFSAKKYDGGSENIRIAVGNTEEDEARFVASDIARKIREEGARYRDFAVIVRSAADYEGIIDRQLTNCGIPSFLSVRTDVKMRPCVRMILLALRIRSHSWQTEDVISYLKCSYTSIPDDICDKIEQYANLWRISGKRWFDDYGWTMNPRGFGKEFTPEDKEDLAQLNKYRLELISPLVKFFDVFEKNPTVEEISYALYKFMCEIRLREHLETHAAKLRDKDRISEADETVQLWNILVESLDSLVFVSGKVKADSSAYSKLLSACLEHSDIGKIPSRIDEVVIGEAPHLRISGVKYLYVMGLCEGVFPAKAREDNILGDSDRKRLKGMNIELSPDSSESARDEMFYFYSALSAAKEKLTLTYNKTKNPSVALSALRGLFADKKSENDINISELPKSYFVWNDMSALEYSYEIKKYDEDEAAKIKDYLAERGNIGFFEETDLVREEYRYTGDKLVFGEYLGLSQSRLESYAMCPFAYYCKYILSLSEMPSAEATSADIGNFVHGFLENFIKKLFAASTDMPSEEEFSRVFAETLDESERALGDISREPRVKMLVERIRKNLVLVTKSLLLEFERSEFKPKFYELSIGKDSVKPITLQLPDGGKVGVYGVIDRVDAYRDDSDGKVYVRVVDYKTGKKVFSRDDLKNGLNMQMLLYLASVCKSTDRKFLEKLGVKDGEAPLPAAVLYLSTKMPEAETVSEKDADSLEKAEETQLAKLKRIGLVTDNTEILRAMDPELKGVFIPVSMKKDGTFSKRSENSLVSSFDDLFNEIDGTVTTLASDMKSGKADALPLKTNNQDACRYCAMGAVCRRKSYCEEHSEILHSVPDDEYNSEGGDL